jgi:excisionase family DNA binding protein
MTPNDAANVLGLTVGQVRYLVRAGKLKARRVTLPGNQFCYKINPASVNAYNAVQRGEGIRKTGRIAKKKVQP